MKQPYWFERSPFACAAAVAVGSGVGCSVPAAQTDEDPTASIAQASVTVFQNQLDGSTISQFVEPLYPLYTSRVDGRGPLTVDMAEFRQKVLPEAFYADLPEPSREGTLLWGYDVNHGGPSWPARTIEARVNTPTMVTYTSSLERPDGSPPILQEYLTQDPTLHWADPTGSSAGAGCVHPTGRPGASREGAIGGTPQAFYSTGPCTKPYVGPVPAVVHLHGGEDPSAYDGHPDAWFTPHLAQTGPGFNTNTYQYPNEQEATALWIHDHALGVTRLNPYAGMVGYYLLRDGRDTGRPDNPMRLPAGPFEQELAIADRIFDTNGQLIFPDGSTSSKGRVNGFNGPPPNPSVHPFWMPEFFGDVITVDGKAWPYMRVEPRRYRLRFLNASNARFYSMQLFEEAKQNGQYSGIATRFTDPKGVGVPGPHLVQIGSDGGFLDAPVDLDAVTLPDTTMLLNTNPNPPHLFLSPAERADILVDFAGLAGRRFILTNLAPAPFPGGGVVTENLPPPALQGDRRDRTVPGPFEVVSQVMEFRVDLPQSSPDTSFNPSGSHPPLREKPIVDLRPEALQHPHQRRQLVLNEVRDVTTGKSLETLVNNSRWDGTRPGSHQVIPGSISNHHGAWATETPDVGSTELWEIANLTSDAHPMHLHLVQFQIIETQPFVSDHATCDSFSRPGQDFANTPAYRPAWVALFPGGTYGGVTFPPHVFIPGYGPPLDYRTPNSDGAVGGNLAFATPLNGAKSAFAGPPVPPLPEDRGWKDTVKMFPCAVTRLSVRFAPQAIPVGSTHPGDNDYSFDPTEGPGYVWHCHILDHEDNEMMRPMLVTTRPSERAGGTRAIAR